VASLLLNLVLGALVAVRVYREWIAPMRRQLIASRAMAERQEKLSSLGVLAAGIAHEIRNPLTSIKARLFAQHKLLPADSPAREDNAVIRDEIGRLEHIVMDFLAFARPTEPVLTELAASAPLEEIATLVRPELERSDIAVNVEVREDSRLRADPQQLKQILLNLVRNAAESIGRDGRITLRAGRRRLRQRGRWMPYAALEVSDTGKGIPPEIQKRLFDPFFTTKQNGTGLGLSITARLVAQQGGLLEYQTELNCGTTFCILLPCVTQAS
jgi:signal transduction histidine kinase